MGRTSSMVKDRYNAKAYDEIKVRVDKGHKVEIQAHAASLGESVNGPTLFPLQVIGKLPK